MQHKPATPYTRFRQYIRFHNMQDFPISERIRHFQRQTRPEILRETAGHFLHTDTGRRHQKINAVGVAFFDDLRHLRVVYFIRFLTESAVIIDYNQNRRLIPAVMIH